MSSDTQIAAIAGLLGCIRAPEDHDLDLVSAIMARSRDEAAVKLQSILVPLFEAGADKALMGDLLTACATVAQMQIMSDLLAVAAMTGVPDDVRAAH